MDMSVNRSFWFSFLLLTMVSTSAWSQEVDAKILASATEGCLPLEISFSNISTGAYDNILWEFEGGNPATSTIDEPVVLYEIKGDYKARLSVFKDGEAFKDSVSIEIRAEQPVPKFSFERVGKTVTFSNESIGEGSFQWEFGDGTFSTETNPVHVYPTEGTYIVSLIEANSCETVRLADVLVIEDHVPPTYTANEVGNPYDKDFKPGVNLGYFPPWNDRTLADIAVGRPDLGIKGAGVKAIRPGLFDHFIQQFGWDARVETYEHFEDIGLEDATLIVGFPSEEHRDPNFYCADHQSELFANLYTPIWDNGENGTPINDENYYAEYLYKLVNLKKDYIQFYEIWNEPGFDFTNVTGYLPPGTDGNWWENNPDPCDYKLRAPIFHYIRILRISYEIIKAIDPESNVTLAAVGYPAFLDAVLRNTDNPDNGLPSSEYPLKGGAYFDAIGMHTYPHFDGTLRAWSDSLQDFIHFRHSDKAITSIPVTKASFENVLKNYGYDGNTYPEKEWIITEINVPRKQFFDFIGSEEAQINFLIKSQVECIRSGIKEMHVFDMAESHYYDEASTEFHMMGFYQRLYSLFPYDQIINNGAIAFKTASDQLYRSTLDVAKTAALNLPVNIDGAAFLDIEGYHTYVLWARTSEDQSEEASAIYSFPASFNISQLEKRLWDNSYSEVVSTSGSQNIMLSGTPIFLKDLEHNTLVPPTPFFDFEILSTCTPAEVDFFDASTSNTTNWSWSFPGGNPSGSNEQNPRVTYQAPGFYDVTLTVSNAAGSKSIFKKEIIEVVDKNPEADFTLEIFDRQVSTHNNSLYATSYIWDMGDSNIFTEDNPSHGYATPGYFTVTLYAINGCDTAIHKEDIIILPEEILPLADFTVTKQGGCPGAQIQFMDASSPNTDTWFWIFNGGVPNISEEQNPLITYESLGAYDVQLVIGNDAGTTTKFRAGYINIVNAPTSDFSYTADGGVIHFVNNATDATSYLWDFGDGTTSLEANPNKTYDFGGTFTVSLTAINNCDSIISSQEITVVGLPFAQFNANQNNPCIPQIEFQSTALGEVDSIRWFFPEGIPSTSIQETVLVDYPQSGNYNATLIAYNDIGSDTSIVSVEVNILNTPQSNFNYSLTDNIYQFSNTSQNAEFYEWDFGDGNTSTAFQPEHAYTASGNYTVTLIVRNNCGSDTLTQVIDFVSSLETISNAHQIAIFPNPTSGMFTILGKGFQDQIVELTLVNNLGENILNQSLICSNGNLSHNIYPPKLPAGAYLLLLKNKSSHIIRKLIIL